MRCTFHKSLLAAALTLTLAGCGTFPRPLVAPVLPVPGETLVTHGDEINTPEIGLETGFEQSASLQIEHPHKGDPLPDKQIKNLSLNESSLYHAILFMLENTGLSVSFAGGADTVNRYGAISLHNLSGSLQSVLDRLSKSIGFFYSLQDGMLTIYPERQFVVEMPPALLDDNAAGMANTMQFLGARDVYLDRINRTLVLRTNRTGHEKIAQYLKTIRESRSMIIYEISIFQVDLKDDHLAGVQWNKLGYGRNGIEQLPRTTVPTQVAPNGVAPNLAGLVTDTVNTAIATQTAGFGLGLVLNSSKFSIDSLISFLQTQGTVKSISRPRLAIISGTKGAIRVGNSITFVSKVGSNSNLGLNQITTETRDIKTGLDLSITGEISDKTVYSRVFLSLSEIVRLKEFTALGTNLTLPDTADRELRTDIRARPGDMILLGGITVERNTFESSRGVSVYSDTKNVAKSELVIALKPKLVHFLSKERVAENKAAANPLSAEAVAAYAAGRASARPDVTAGPRPTEAK